jgi:hypothetical protein
VTRALRLYSIGLVAISLFGLIATSFVLLGSPGYVLASRTSIALPSDSSSPEAVALGIAFWTVITLFASALPVRMPRGSVVSVSIAPIVAAIVLGGPAAAGWIAAVGTTEMRELRREIPWYGTLSNHACIVLPAVVAGHVFGLLATPTDPPAQVFAACMCAAIVYFFLNVAVASIGIALRQGLPIRVVAVGDTRSYLANLFALAPLAWLMSSVYELPQRAGWWATILFALPLYTTRLAHHRFVEMREMFTQTIASLAQAVDKRDKFTSGHSLRVKEIAVDIGREMRVSEPELEALEWGGLLHDVGKIGVPDSVLLKQDRLTREERMKMNAHPVLGDEIIAPVAKLAAERPIIRHHHEWYNGSGYPDRLIGDEIPKLARILHVADAFEAMTAARPYRMTPLTAEQALGELRKFAGIQFDPAVVDAFVKTRWVDGVADPGGNIQPRPIPLLAQAASRMGAGATMSGAAVMAGPTAMSPTATISQTATRSEPTAPAH